MSKFYPSKPRQNSAKPTDWKTILNNANANLNLDLSSPVKFNDSAVNACFDKWQKRFTDEWVNPIANIGAGNAITQYTEFINKRISYAESAFLANDTIINNAISKIANEIFRKGGKIVLENVEQENETEYIKALEKRLDKLDFFSVLHKAVTTTLTYGGALIYIDTNLSQNTSLADPIYFKRDLITSETITNLRVIEPYLCGAVDVNSSNPLNVDFMQPNKWYVSGAGVLDKSRVVPLTFFSAPDMLKPLYNYFGISLPQFMRDYIKIADGARQALGDIFVRFRTTILKTDLSKISAQEAMDRVAAINKLRNNLGTLLLTSDEEYIESVTNLTNLDKLLAQMQENIAVSARMPAVKLLGLTPSGFNATGDFDLKSYYDEIMSYQNGIIKPVIESFLRIFALELRLDIYPKYEFENLNGENALNQAQINTAESAMVANLIQSGIITQEQGFNYLQGKKIIDKGENFDESADDFDGEFNNNVHVQDGFFRDWVKDTNKNFSENAMYDLERNKRPLSFFTKTDILYFEKLLNLKKNSIDRQTFYDFLKDKGKVIETNKNSEFFNEHTWHHLGNRAEPYYFYSVENALENSNKGDIKKYFSGYDGDFSEKDNIKEKMSNFLKENLENDLHRVNRDYPAKENEFKSMDDDELNGDKRILKLNLANLKREKTSLEYKHKIYNESQEIISANDNIKDDTITSYKRKINKLGQDLQLSGEWKEGDHPRDDDEKFKAK